MSAPQISRCIVHEGRSGFDLFYKSPLIMRASVASFKYELADPGAGVQGQGSVPQVHDLQGLMVRDARMHEAGGDMHREAKTREPASPFEPAGYGVGKGDLLLCDPQDHLPGLDDDVAAVLDVDLFSDILKVGMVLYVIDFCLFLKDPEIIAKRKVDRTRPDLRSVERLDPDQLLL